MSTASTSPASVLPIDKNWEFTQRLTDSNGREPTVVGDEWFKAVKFPTNVHSELLKLKRIPDPFIGLNEYDVQWIGETDWLFKAEFEVKEGDLQQPDVDLVSEGLDTYANVTLNGRTILEANNMFVEYRVPVKAHLKEGINELAIHFPSAYLRGLELETKNGKKHVWNGNSSRLHVRKAQYHYGWDWGPNIMTVGPWKPIYLHAYTARVSDLHIKSTLSDALDVAKLDISIAVSSTPVCSPPGLQATVTINKPDGCVLATYKVPLTSSASEGLDLNGKLELELNKKEDIALWWPVGYGAQPLYTVNVEIHVSEEDDLPASAVPLATKSQRFGLRRVKVVQEPLEGQEGLSFLFEVNNVRIFVGGSNWIPADSFLTEMSDKRYVAWLKLLVQGNQNMIRVWGGGILEPDIFYDTCDELGIMVWQDFMFACGQYPAHDDFLVLVRTEAEQAVVRLRHHPSLVIYAGNNEDYMLAEISKFPIDWSDLTSDPRQSALPARYIYETVLPEIVDRLGGGDVYYHRSSPYSIPGKSSMDLNHGDLHNWNVWHGEQLEWQKWEYMSARFVSEFGMQGLPDRRTVDYWVGENKAERQPQSRTHVSHNKATGHEKRLAQYLVENFRYSLDTEGYIYATQMLQSEAVASAYRVWRRNWKGRGKEYSAGVLVWQLNDCWPVTSWSLVDYFLRPKPTYYTVARELRPVTVGIARYEKKGPPPTNPRSATVQSQFYFAVWGTNGTLEPVSVTLVLEAFDLHDEKFQWKQEQEIVLPPNCSTDLSMAPLPGQSTLTKRSEVPRTIILSARLVDREGAIISRNANWPEPYKFIHFPSVEEIGLNLKLETTTVEKVETTSLTKNVILPLAENKKFEDVTQITLSSRLPVKGIVLDADGEADVWWSDQAIDLIPGDEQVVFAWGLDGRVPKARYLGDGTV